MEMTDSLESEFWDRLIPKVYFKVENKSKCDELDFLFILNLIFLPALAWWIQLKQNYIHLKFQTKKKYQVQLGNVKNQMARVQYYLP